MKFRKIVFELPKTDIQLRWKIEPLNRITKLLWHFLNFNITIDYLQLVSEKTKKELDSA